MRCLNKQTMLEGKSPFVFLPSAAKTPLSLVTFARNLDPTTGFYSCEYRGMDGTEDLDASLEETAAGFVEQITAMRAQTSICLGGQCFGGTVAFEMAKQLNDRGFTIDKLILLDTLPPLLASNIESTIDTADEQNIWQLTQQAIATVCDQSRAQFAHFPDEIRQPFERILTRQLDFGNSYRSTPVDTDIYLLITQQYDEAIFKNWQSLARNKLEQIRLPVDRSSVLDSNQVSTVANVVSKILEIDTKAP